jgi:hypothetical protein
MEGVPSAAAIGSPEKGRGGEGGRGLEKRGGGRVGRRAAVLEYQMSQEDIPNMLPLSPTPAKPRVVVLGKTCGLMRIEGANEDISGISMTISLKTD